MTEVVLTKEAESKIISLPEENKKELMTFLEALQYKDLSMLNPEVVQEGIYVYSINDYKVFCIHAKNNMSNPVLIILRIASNYEINEIASLELQNNFFKDCEPNHNLATTDQSSQNLPSQFKPKNPNWSLNLALMNLALMGTLITAGGVVATLITVPEFRCFLLGWSCPAEFADVELFMRTESGELLGGVDITVFDSSGAPETTQTDDNGYARVTIATQGEVKVNLSKSGYPAQNFTINLQNEQGTVRTIRFRPSGEPEIITSSTPPTPPPSTVRAFTPQFQTITAVENDFMSMELKGVSKDQRGDVRLAFVITNKTSDNLYLGLSNKNYGTITDNFGQVCDRQTLQGLANVGSSSNTPDNFTLISPNSILTVGSYGCRFPTSTEFNASFLLVRYQPSTINPAGEQTKFSVGFTGIKLTE